MIENVPLEYLGGYTQKPQKVENCAWASSKGAVGILCKLCSDQKIGELIYKKFTHYAREKALNTYLKLNYENKDINLIRKIIAKRTNKKNKTNKKNVRLYIKRVRVLLGEQGGERPLREREGGVVLEGL